MAATQSMPVLPPNRRGIVGQLFVLVGAVSGIAIAVIVALIVTWPDHGDSSQSAVSPPPVPAKQAGKSPAQAAAAIKP
jgi:hypothetical protein